MYFLANWHRFCVAKVVIGLGIAGTTRSRSGGEMQMAAGGGQWPLAGKLHRGIYWQLLARQFQLNAPA